MKCELCQIETAVGTYVIEHHEGGIAEWQAVCDWCGKEKQSKSRIATSSWGARPEYYTENDIIPSSFRTADFFNTLNKIQERLTC